MPFRPTPRKTSAKGCVPQRLSTEIAVVRLGNPNLPASHSAAAARSAMHNWRVRAHCRCVQPTLHALPAPYCCCVSLATPIPYPILRCLLAATIAAHLASTMQYT